MTATQQRIATALAHFETYYKQGLLTALEAAMLARKALANQEI